MAESGDKLKELCFYCKKITVKCVNCNVYFHKSCANRINCCKNKEIVEESEVKNGQNKDNLQDTNNIVEETIILENRKLNALNNELTKANEQLKQTIRILENQISELQEGKPKHQSHSELPQKVVETIKLNIRSQIESSNDKFRENIMETLKALIKEGIKEGLQENRQDEKMQERHRLHQVNKGQKLRDNQSTKKGTQIGNNQLDAEYRVEQLNHNKHVLANSKDPANVDELETAQKNIMQRIIDLDKTNQPQQSNVAEKIVQNINDSDEKILPQNIHDIQQKNKQNKYEWQTQETKKNMYQRRRVGQAEASNSNFKGAKPKVWMYLYKVESDATEEDIKEYLQKKTGNVTENFIVEDLKATGRYKDFKIGADFSFKGSFYNDQFWPMGVRYKRFDFAYYKQKIGAGKYENLQPVSFLENRLN